MQLINRASINGSPITPLRPIDSPKIASFIRPFIPDRNAVIVEVFYIRLPTQKPEQLVNDGFDVQLFGRQQRKPIVERKSGLSAKNRIGSCAGPVRARLSFIEHEPQKVLVLNHLPKEF